MNLENFQFNDALTMSLFAILVVFIILILLQMVIYAFKFLPKELNGQKAAAPVVASAPMEENDEEERMVAMLTASILAKEEYAGNVKVKSIKRIG